MLLEGAAFKIEKKLLSEAKRLGKHRTDQEALVAAL
jgi:hypothetical protein